MDGQGTKRHKKTAENYNRLSKVHERYRRQTDIRQMEGRQLSHEVLVQLMPLSPHHLFLH